MTTQEMAALHATCFEVPRPWTMLEFEGFLADKTCYFVMEDAGFALGRIAGPEVELLTLAVAPEARRAGIGARLLAGFEQMAATRGAQEAFLEVSDQNSGAIALYRGAGYTDAGHRKDYYAGPTGERISALVMVKKLA